MKPTITLPQTRNLSVVGVAASPTGTTVSPNSDPSDDRLHICVPDTKHIRSDLLHGHHDAITAGHLGQQKPQIHLAYIYYWPGLSKDVK